MLCIVRKRRRRTALSHHRQSTAKIRLASPSSSTLLLLCSSCILLASLASGASQSTSLQYPNKNLGPSLAASAAASTVVAVTVPPSGKDGQEGNCCVILTKSFVHADNTDEENDVDGALMISSATTRKGAASDTTDDQDDDDINASVTKEQEEELQPICPGRYSPSLSILSSSSSPLILALTGFGPDVHHLSLSAAKVYSNHVHLYGGTVMRTDKMATVMADRLAGAAMSESSRPYGVQALVVGDRLVSSSNGSASNGNGSGARVGEMQLYTIDPAGGCRHWSGGGTVVGRDADMVRACLGRCLRPTKRGGSIGDSTKIGSGRGTPLDWTEALDRALLATIEASPGDDGDEGRYDEDGYAKSGRYGAIVAFSRGSGTHTSMHGHDCKCFQIGAETIEDSYKRCIRLLKEESSDRKGGGTKRRNAN